MAQQDWNPAGMRQPLVLPGDVADRCLSLASREQLQVLLWLSRRQLDWDAAACAAALHLSEEECEGCRRFWEEQGILTTAGSPATPAAPAVSRPAARPAAVKPQLKEVLTYQKQHPEFSVLVEAASARLGKAIGHSDTATLLYLLDTVGLPMDVILTEIAYAVSIGKPHMRYIEKIALDWADQDMTTLPAVDAHIHYLERCRKAAERVEALLALPRPLTAAQAQLAEKWLFQWGFRDDMVQCAATITVDKAGTFKPGYADKILEQWHAEGIDRPDKIPATPAKKKKGAAATNPEESSLDIQGFEAELLRYRPTFRQK